MESIYNPLKELGFGLVNEKVVAEKGRFYITAIY
jgi:hypothetical protein